MLRRFSFNFTIFSMLMDGLMVLGSLVSMSYLRIVMNKLNFIAYLPADIRYPVSLYVIFPLIWVGLLAGFSIYDGKKFFKLVDELSTLTIASLVASISQAGILYLTYRDFSRALFLMIVAVSFLLCLLWRLVARLVFRLRKETLNISRNLLIVGTGSELHKVEKAIRQNSLGDHIIVQVLDLKNPQDFVGETPDFCPETVALVRSRVNEAHISDVVIAFPRSTSDWIAAISSHLEDLSLGVWVALDFYDLSLSDTRVENLAGLPLLDLRAPALDDYSRILKRAFDLVVGCLTLVIISPILLLVALIILIVDGWPVLFLQDRVGENGRLFKMIKFRTMVRDAEKLRVQVERIDEHGNIIHKSLSDPRITRSGRLLRKLSLDEFPQLINVIKGEMSIVGPRPELPYLVENYERWQRRRFTVPSGITGWWQVNGRSERVMHLHTEDDLYYVDNYSIWLDIRILIRTAWVVLVGKGSF
ncbi:MAG: sugar transferase [Pelolinea sp.]|nr:sugar transferase [Pelolinea sp.]